MDGASAVCIDVEWRPDEYQKRASESRRRPRFSSRAAIMQLAFYPKNLSEVFVIDLVHARSELRHLILLLLLNRKIVKVRAISNRADRISSFPNQRCSMAWERTCHA